MLYYPDYSFAPYFFYTCANRTVFIGLFLDHASQSAEFGQPIHVDERHVAQQHETIRLQQVHTREFYFYFFPGDRCVFSWYVSLNSIVSFTIKDFLICIISFSQKRVNYASFSSHSFSRCYRIIFVCLSIAHRLGQCTTARFLSVSHLAPFPH